MGLESQRLMKPQRTRRFTKEFNQDEAPNEMPKREVSRAMNELLCGVAKQESGYSCDRQTNSEAGKKHVPQVFDWIVFSVVLHFPPLSPN